MPYEPNYSTTKGSLSGAEELARCKQCGAPVTTMNVVKGPTGVFCGPVCKEKHEQFVLAAAATERREGAAGGLFFARMRRLMSTIVFVLVAIFVVGFVARVLGINIPVVTPVFESLWQFGSGLAR